MYNPALEASYDQLLTTRWNTVSMLLIRLIEQAGPEALEGAGRAEFVTRAMTVLRPIAQDTLTASRTNANRQLRGMGRKAVEADLAELALTRLDVDSLIRAAARYYFSAGHKKDFTDPATKAQAFRYAAELVGRQTITMLSDKRLAATSATYSAAGIRLYERYLGSGDHCDLCKQIAGTRVTRDDIKPVHDKCTCGVRPVR